MSVVVKAIYVNFASVWTSQFATLRKLRLVTTLSLSFAVVLKQSLVDA